MRQRMGAQSSYTRARAAWEPPLARHPPSDREIDPKTHPAYYTAVMFRRFYLMVAALAILVASIAMQSSMAMAAMPNDHRQMAQTGHCGETAPEKSANKSGAMTQCCFALCSAVAPSSTPSVEPFVYDAPLLFGWGPTDLAPFLTELPTPPPRMA